jgi:hypothetical protein
MANETPQAAGAQPQPGTTAQVETSGHTPGSDTTNEQFDASSAIDSMTDVKAMEEILFGEKPPTAPAPSAQETPEEPAQGANPAESTQPGSEQHGTDDDDASSPASREPNEQGPDRISLRTLPPAERKLVTEAVNLFRSGKAATMADALTQLGLAAGSTPQEQPAAQESQQQAPDPAPAPQPDAPPPDPEVARIAAVLADLREQRRKAIAEYDRETEAQLTDQIEDAVAELSEAKATARIEKQNASRQDQLIQSAVEEVNLKFPEAEDPDSFFSYRLSRALDKYEETYGPIRQNPGQLLVLAEKVQQDIGPAMGQPRQPVHQAPKPDVQARPLGIAAQGQNAPPRLTGEALQRAVDSATPEQLFEALTGV